MPAADRSGRRRGRRRADLQSCRIPVDVPAVIPLAGTAGLLSVGIRVGILSAVHAGAARLVCVGAVRPGVDRRHAVPVRRPADPGGPHAHGLLRGGGGRGVPVLPVRRASGVGAAAQGDHLAGGILLHDLSGAFAAVQGADRPADSRAHGRMVVRGHQRADVRSHVARGVGVRGGRRHRGTQACAASAAEGTAVDSDAAREERGVVWLARLA